jgi:hypothetical protein
MKRLIGVIAVAVMMLAGGAALAQGTGHQHGGSTAGAVRKYQKETLNLRDELAAKQLDLEAEYDKSQPDQTRIASLRKEIVDLEARIQVVADNYGVRPSGRGHGRGMMYGSYGSGGWSQCGCGGGCW